MTSASICRPIDNEQIVTGPSKWMSMKVKFEGDRIKKLETNLKGQSPIETDTEIERRHRHKQRETERQTNRQRLRGGFGSEQKQSKSIERITQTGNVT